MTDDVRRGREEELYVAVGANEAICYCGRLFKSETDPPAQAKWGVWSRSVWAQPTVHATSPEEPSSFPAQHRTIAACIE